MPNQSQVAKPKQNTVREKKEASQSKQQGDIAFQIASMLSSIGCMNLSQLGEESAEAASLPGNQLLVSLLSADKVQDRASRTGSILSGAQVPLFSNAVPICSVEPQAPFTAQSVPVFSVARTCDYSMAEAISAPFA